MSTALNFACAPVVRAVFYAQFTKSEHCSRPA